MTNLKKTNPNPQLPDAEIPEVQSLYEGIKKGVAYLRKQFDMLEDEGSEIDPNDVVKWIEKSYAMAQNVIAFYHLIYDEEGQRDNVRGGAKVNKFEVPQSGIR